MLCIKNGRQPLLKQLLYTLLYSWLSMILTLIALIMVYILTDDKLLYDLSEIASTFMLGCFFFTIWIFPINVYLLLIIRFSGILPFIMCSPLLICVESCIFNIFLNITGHLFLQNGYLDLLVSAILILILSFIFRILFKSRCRAVYLTYLKIVKASSTCYIVNKEVDIFFIIIIISIVTLMFLTFQ